MDEATEVMHIRIPKDLAAKIREVSKVENTHLGIALKFIIEQATNDKIETRLTAIEGKIGKGLGKKELREIGESIKIIAEGLVEHLGNHIIYTEPLERIAGINKKAKINKGKASKDHIT